MDISSIIISRQWKRFLVFKNLKIRFFVVILILQGNDLLPLAKIVASEFMIKVLLHLSRHKISQFSIRKGLMELFRTFKQSIQHQIYWLKYLDFRRMGLSDSRVGYPPFQKCQIILWPSSCRWFFGFQG